MTKPLHALDWIKRSGCYLRTISAEALRRHLGRRKGQCTWCGARVAGQRRTWCGDDCVEQYLCRCSRTHISFLVKQRDSGICALCGCNALELAALANSIASNVRQLGGCLNSLGNRRLYAERVATLPRPTDLHRQGWSRHYRRLRRLCSCVGCLAQREFCEGDAPWQADHTLPVCEGGGLCDLSGYRTLCTPCHKRETEQLTERRKKAKPRKGRKKPNRRRR